MDKNGSSSAGSLKRCVSLIGMVGLAMLTPACAKELDTEREPPSRGTVGEEMFGVVCDRVGAQALREDLTGDSFRGICHKSGGKTGNFKDKVDTSFLPALDPGAVDEQGRVVPMDKQRADREKAIGKIEALGRRRGDLIRALDATFPDTDKVAIKDLNNPDPTKTCDAPKKSGEGFLTDQLADMLGKMGDLYNDGTIPQSTESLASVIDTFKKDDAAQEAWARLSAREGYRPVETALGAARPMIAYPNLREFSNASLRLLAADSNPYERNPKLDADGNRIPTPGAANAAFNKLLEAAHQEMLAVKADPKPGLLTVTTDPALGRPILSRPRDNLEILQELLFTQDASFGTGTGTPMYIVRRDSRGYARIAGGALPSPFLDADKDGLPDVDDVGRFKTANGSLAPTPFPFAGGALPTTTDVQRDKFGRPTVGTSALLYDYIDTTHSFAAQAMIDMKPLAQNGALVDMTGGLYVALGPRGPQSKQYGSTTVNYDGVVTKTSPMLDLVYAMGALLGDRTMDTTLDMTKQLVEKNPGQLARLSGAMIAAFDIAQKHPEAKMAKTSTFWDENLDVMAQMVKEPGLMEDLLRALASPQAANIGSVFAKYATFKDEITYDKNDINGAPWNVTTNSKSEPKTAWDGAAPKTGKNRSELYRFLGLINDTLGVTACNKDKAVVHAKLGGISVTMPLIGDYSECEVFKIDNLAQFYVDVMAEAWQYDPDTKPVKRGTFYLRNDLLRTGIAGIGAATTSLMEDSSGLTGFVDTGNDKLLTPKPAWLNRLVFFDVKNDSINTQTKNFIRDLQGDYMGTSVCPERTINDPNPSAPDASPDKIVHGLRNCPDGQWLQQRGVNTIFTWEHFGFYDAIKPIVGAFAKHGREDLFLALSSSVYKHFPGQDASADECRLAGGKQCPRDGMNTYEGLISEAFATDVLPAVSELAKALDTLSIKRCDAYDSRTHQCTASTMVSGIDVAAAAARAALDVDYAKNTLKLTDRRGAVTGKRNDGTTFPQVTPAILLANALSGIDDAFDQYEAQHPEDTSERRAGWRSARSALVDQFLGTNGIKSNSTFKDPAITKIGPVLVDVLRGQLLAHCPNSFAPPYERCAWARDELPKHAEETMGGPLMNTAVELMDKMRSDDEAKKQLQLLMAYLLDQGSKNDALASMLASANDTVQVLRDDDNLVPLMHVLASAMDASQKNDKGQITKMSLVDAQMSLLAKLSGKYYDEAGKEICSKEIDPNQVLAAALGNLVTPIKDGDFKGQTPLEVIIDVIADVNRVDPSQPYEGTLAKSDYKAVSENVVDFLTNKERGLEQFYEVIRQGTKF